MFVDANIFVYHFVADSILGPPCSFLMNRIESGEVLGFTVAVMRDRGLTNLVSHGADFDRVEGLSRYSPIS